MTSQINFGSAEGTTIIGSSGGMPRKNFAKLHLKIRILVPVKSEASRKPKKRSHMLQNPERTRGAGVFLPGGQNLKKGIFLLKRHCQQKQILVVMLQFEILVDMIEFQFAQDRSVSRKSFILLICYFGLINFSANANSF